MYLDHEAEWPASKERSARWVGVAHGISDALTFRVLDDPSKQILARSVVRPFNKNHRVKWDPLLENVLDKATATSAGEGLSSVFVAENRVGKEVIVIEDNIPTHNSGYVNPGLKMEQLYFPKDSSIITRSKGKLMIDNAPMQVDETNLLPDDQISVYNLYWEVQIGLLHWEGMILHMQ